jgi:hypothetical protein
VPQWRFSMVQDPTDAVIAGHSPVLANPVTFDGMEAALPLPPRGTASGSRRAMHVIRFRDLEQAKRFGEVWGTRRHAPSGSC